MGNTHQSSHNNTRIAYEYTESSLNKTNEGIDRINGRLTTTLGSSALLLKFSSDLPSCEPSLILMKVFSCITLVAVIGLCLTGLLPRASGDVIKPYDLLETEWFYKEEHLCRLYIAREWKEAIEQLEKVYFKKTKLLEYAYIGLFLTSIFFGINIIIETCFKCSNP